LSLGTTRDEFHAELHDVAGLAYSRNVVLVTAAKQPLEGKRHAMQTAAYAFAPEELRRLAAYRSAMIAGFYTDWCPEPASAWCQDLVRISQAHYVDESATYEFSVAEVTRLQAYKAFVSAGVFSDSLEPA
jgi:hypothetical protein